MDELTSFALCIERFPFLEQDTCQLHYGFGTFDRREQTFRLTTFGTEGRKVMGCSLIYIETRVATDASARMATRNE